MILPQGAKDIVAARMNGLKPADMIIVSLIGPPREANPTVYVNPTAAYDWRWAVELKLCIYTNQRTPWLETAKAIAGARPEWLGLWDVDAFQGADVYALPRVDDIAKPASQWRWELHFMPWLGFQNYQFAWGD